MFMKNVSKLPFDLKIFKSSENKNTKNGNFQTFSKINIQAKRLFRKKMSEGLLMLLISYNKE